MVHYGLTHIALPKILNKFPPKAHIFMEFKNLFKKLYQGQYSLAHIFITRILKKFPSKFPSLTNLSFARILLSFHERLMLYFLFQKSLRFKKFESQTIWFELYGPFRKHWSDFIKNTNSKVRSRKNVVWTALSF